MQSTCRKSWDKVKREIATRSHQDSSWKYTNNLTCHPCQESQQYSFGGQRPQCAADLLASGTAPQTTQSWNTLAAHLYGKTPQRCLSISLEYGVIDKTLQLILLECIQKLSALILLATKLQKPKDLFRLFDRHLWLVSSTKWTGKGLLLQEPPSRIWTIRWQ